MSNLNKEVYADLFVCRGGASNEYQHLRYDLITTIEYNYMTLGTDGSISPCYGYDPGPTISYAHSKGVKVILEFINAGVSADPFLGDPTVKTKVINNIVAEVIAKGFDGVTNDIEAIEAINSITGTSNTPLITAFQKQLSETLWAHDPNYISNRTIGEVNWGDVYDTVALNPYVTHFEIMAYSFGRDPSSSIAAPYTPMNDSRISSNRPKGVGPCVDYWLAAPRSIPPNKILLGCTYEGMDWPTVSNARYAATTGTGTVPLYDQWVQNISQYTRIWDTEWQTPYFVRQVSGNWHQTHIDDPQSLGVKYDLVNSKGLAGIFIWTIEVGTDRTELWQVIQDKFGAAIPISVTISISPNIITLGQSVTFAITVSGGTPPYTYSWTGLPTGCVASNSNIITCIPTIVGSYPVTVTVKDSAVPNQNTVSAQGTLTVNPQTTTNPTFIQEAETAWNSSTSPKTTPMFNAKKGDILVAYSMMENYGTLTISGGSLTWTLRQSVVAPNYAPVYVWTATVDVDKTMSVKFSTSSPLFFGGCVLTFRNSSGIGNSSKTYISSGAPILNITTTKSNSAIVVANCDWIALDGSSRIWRTNAGTFNEKSYFRDSARYTVYGGCHPNARAIGTYAIGLSSPLKQKYSIVAVEIKG